MSGEKCDVQRVAHNIGKSFSRFSRCSLVGSIVDIIRLRAKYIEFHTISSTGSRERAIWRFRSITVSVDDVFLATCLEACRIYNRTVIHTLIRPDRFYFSHVWPFRQLCDAHMLEPSLRVSSRRDHKLTVCRGPEVYNIINIFRFMNHQTSSLCIDNTITTHNNMLCTIDDASSVVCFIILYNSTLLKCELWAIWFCSMPTQIELDVRGVCTYSCLIIRHLMCAN